MNFFEKQQGWICPKCGRVYSPTTSMCFYCGNETVTVSSEDDTNTIPKKYKHEKLLKDMYQYHGPSQKIVLSDHLYNKKVSDE